MTETARELKSCIDECQQCHATCAQTLQYCLKQGGRHTELEHVRLMLDCIQICATSADFMLRGSPRHARTCGVCAEVCAQCAESCGQMGDDQAMRRCAEVCRQCATSCGQMAAA